jgi:hypothetical protein
MQQCWFLFLFQWCTHAGQTLSLHAILADPDYASSQHLDHPFPGFSVVLKGFSLFKICLLSMSYWNISFFDVQNVTL